MMNRRVVTVLYLATGVFAITPTLPKEAEDDSPKEDLTRIAPQKALSRKNASRVTLMDKVSIAAHYYPELHGHPTLWVTYKEESDDREIKVAKDLLKNVLQAHYPVMAVIGDLSSAHVPSVGHLRDFASLIRQQRHSLDNKVDQAIVILPEGRIMQAALKTAINFVAHVAGCDVDGFTSVTSEAEALHHLVFHSADPQMQLTQSEDEDEDADETERAVM